MEFSRDEKNILEEVNRIGLEMISTPEMKDFIFILLSPYLDKLTEMLKRLHPEQVGLIFFRYEGVSNVMRMIEQEAQKMENELHWT